MDVQEIYRQKLISVEEAASFIKSHDRIFSSGVAGYPVDLLVAIGKRYEELEDVEIFGCMTTYPFNFLKAECKGHIKFTCYFIGPLERQYYPQGNVGLISHHFSRADWMIHHRFKPTVFIADVSPPDEKGNMSLGPCGTFNGKTAAEYADTVIVSVNQKQPYVYGNERAFLNVREVTHICEADRALPEVLQQPGTEVENKIASNLLHYIEDGSTIQIGLGGVANAVALGLEHHKDLGVHTEMIVDSLVVLAEKGVVNGSKKEIHNGIIVCGFGFGSKKVYEFMNKNRKLNAYPQSYVNDPNTIAKHKNFISINSCMTCDLTGQVGSESLGFNQFSGTGGQLDFVRGAALAENGKSFLCMNSTAKLKDGTMVSRINTILPPGTAITTPRSDVQYIVTEYGVADIKDRSIQERVEAIINIAHPDFREQLLKEAFDNRIIYK